MDLLTIYFLLLDCNINLTVVLHNGERAEDLATIRQTTEHMVIVGHWLKNGVN